MALHDYNTLMIANELNERGIPTPGKFREQRKENITWNRKVSDAEWFGQCCVIILIQGH